MATVTVNRKRSKRRAISAPSPSLPPSNQVMLTRLSATGVAIRPPKTIIRRMDNRGVGSVAAY